MFIEDAALLGEIRRSDDHPREILKRYRPLREAIFTAIETQPAAL